MAEIKYAVRPTLVFVSLLCIVFLSACDLNNADKKHIVDLSSDATIILKHNDSEALVHSYRLRGTGSNSGQGRLELMLNGQIYRSVVLTGDFAFEWAGDWYSPQMVLKYSLENPGSGSLVIDYALIGSH